MERVSQGESTVSLLRRGIQIIEDNIELSFLSLRKHLNLNFWLIAVLANITAWGFEQYYANPALSTLPFRIAAYILVLPLFVHPYPKNDFLRNHQKSLFVLMVTITLPLLFGWNGLANAALNETSNHLNGAWLVEYSIAIFCFLGMFSNPKYSLALAFLTLLATTIVAWLAFRPATEAFWGTALFMAATIATAYCFMLLTQHQMRYVHQKKILTASAIGARVAHELRTPLLSISNFTANAEKILKQERGFIPSAAPHALSYLEKVQQEVRFSNKTIDILLMSTKSAPFHIDPRAAFTASATIPAAIADYPYANSAEKSSIQYQGGQDFLGAAPGELVKHLIYNLVKNAFLSSLSPSDTDIRISHEKRGDTGVLIVSDNGPGIPGNLKHKVFEDFFTTRVTGDGTGLGLSFCRSFMTQIGGEIEYERIDDRSVFVMRFPTKTSQ